MFIIDSDICVLMKKNCIFGKFEQKGALVSECIGKNSMCVDEKRVSFGSYEQKRHSHLRMCSQELYLWRLPCYLHDFHTHP